MAAVESQRTISIVIANGTKVDSYAPAGAALLVVSFFFITLSALNISLVWIETASAAKRLKMLSGNRIQAYKNFLFAYYVIFLTLLATFIATDHLVLADAVVIPAFLFIAVSYLYGWLLLRPLLNDSQLASDSKKKTEVLALIAQTALILSLFCVVLVGSAIVLALYGDKNTGSSPIAQPASITLGILGDSAAAIEVVVMRYCFWSSGRYGDSSSHTSISKSDKKRGATIAVVEGNRVEYNISEGRQVSSTASKA